MKRTVYFIRHSLRDETIHHEQAPLSSKGLALAQKLVLFFEDKKVEAIYVSPFLRTLQTAQPLVELFELSLQMIPEFRERKIGEWLFNFNEFANKQWSNFDFKLSHGESLNEVAQRVYPAFQNILKTAPENLVIVGHGTAFSVLFKELTEGEFDYLDFCLLKMPDVLVGTFQEDQLLELEVNVLEKQILEFFVN
ncbi:histidine phosphatase family protein [Vagococcus sp.]|uniref:histidine phosphatase family protein n=1 Tax=Vagococcus sp. TaxID=1933889 RepID=UPI003F996E8A